jgi:hypothetical protein
MSGTPIDGCKYERGNDWLLTSLEMSVGDVLVEALANEIEGGCR